MGPLKCLEEQRRKHKEQWNELVTMCENENEDGDYDSILWAEDEMLRLRWRVDALVKLTRDFIANPKLSKRDDLTDFLDELEVK